MAKTSFGAKIHKPTFGIAATAPLRLNLLRIEEELSDAHVRLFRVFIENKPYDEVIQRFDKPDTLFYVDSPYWGNKRTMTRVCQPGGFRAPGGPSGWSEGQAHPEPQ